MTNGVRSSDCTAILLSYKRPSNIEHVVRVCLAQPGITRVIVSNSNFAVDITRWVSVRDGRLVLINEAARTVASAIALCSPPKPTRTSSCPLTTTCSWMACS